jgi:hypothetical protein
MATDKTPKGYWHVGGVNTGKSSFGGLRSINNYHPANSPTSNTWSTTGANDYVTYQISGIGGSSPEIALSVAYLQHNFQKKQLDLAKDYYNINVIDSNFYENYYQPRFKQFRDTAFNTPYYSTNYITPRSGSIARVKEYDEKWLIARKNMPRYAVGLGKEIDYTFFDLRRKALAAAYVAGTRMEDARKDWKDEQIHSHRVQALNLGIAVGNVAKQGLAQSTGVLEQAYDEMSSRIGGLASGLGRFLGYNRGKDIGKEQLDASSHTGIAMAPYAQGD